MQTIFLDQDAESRSEIETDADVGREAVEVERRAVADVQVDDVTQVLGIDLVPYLRFAGRWLRQRS